MDGAFGVIAITDQVEQVIAIGRVGHLAYETVVLQFADGCLCAGHFFDHGQRYHHGEFSSIRLVLDPAIGKGRAKERKKEDAVQ